MTSPFATLAGKRYRLALLDPPWAFATYTGGTRTPTAKNFAASGPGSHAGAGAGDHYPTMTVAQMLELPLGEIMEPDSVIAMWIVGSHCDAALELARGWGFKFKTDLFYWLKTKLINANQIDLFTGDIAPPKISMGYYTRKQLEPCRLFTRGKGLPVLDHGVRQLIIEPPREHSRKPVEQYARLEALFGTTIPRIELFSRAPREGWDAWGNETDKFGEAA